MKNVFKRLGLLLLSLFLLVYVGYQIFQVFYSNVTLETVNAYSVYETVETQAIAIRRETPVQAEIGDGHLFYTLRNGNRVAKGGTIAEIFASEDAAGVQQRLEQLDEDIAALAAVEALGTNNYSSLEAINQQLSTTARAVSVQMNGANTEGARDLHTQLLTLMNKRQITIGTVESFSDRLVQLRQQREALAASATARTGVVGAPVAGYFIDEVDGFETYFPTDEEDIAALTVEDVEKALSASPTASARCVGKVAQEYTWYLACVIDAKKAAQISAGKTLHVQLPFVTGEPVETVVVAVNTDTSGKASVIVKCSRMSEELAAIRVQTAQLLLKEYSGLRLPDKALQFDDENRTGAYVRVGTTISFRYVNVLYHNEKDGYSICEIRDEGDYVQLYDDVIVGGKDLYDGKVVQS